MSSFWPFDLLVSGTLPKFYTERAGGASGASTSINCTTTTFRVHYSTIVGKHEK